MDSEVGRELSAAELVPKTVVVLGREDRPGVLITAWVSEVGQDFVAFYAGVSRIVLLLRLREDGTLADDTGLLMHVWEYLGEV